LRNTAGRIKRPGSRRHNENSRQPEQEGQR
jgi:hypothetical protein